MQPKQKKKEEPTAAGAAGQGEYVPLSLIGKIREKGFSSEESSNISSSSRHCHRVSAPQPRVTPFPVARHRSEGPHWAPQSSLPVQSADAATEDLEDKDGEHLAFKAQPIFRKKKKAIDFSKWKAEKGSQSVSNMVRESETETETHVSSAQLDIIASSIHEQEDQPDNLSCINKNAMEHRARLATGDSLPDSYDSASPQLPSISVPSRENEKTGLSRTSEDIATMNEYTVESMTNEQIAEAQRELAERFRPEILDMLRRRGKEKAEKEGRSGSNMDGYVGEAFDSKSKVKHEFIQQSEQSEDAGCAGVEALGSTLTASASSMQTNLGSRFVWEGKHWTERVEAVRTYRFGLDGNFVGADPMTVSPTAEASDKESGWKIPNVTERDFLRMEGDPSFHGYTIKELVALTRSMVPAQRSAALRLLANILNKAVLALQFGVGDKTFGMTSTSAEVLDWEAIWAYALGPEPELVLTLRIALDDSHATAVVTCARTLEFLLSSSANEHHFNMCESLLPSEYNAFTAPIFKKPFFKESGVMEDCFWKFNVKPMDMFPYLKNSQSQGEDTDITVKDDSFVANQDAAAGLIRMGILPRIRYLLEVERLTSAEDSLFAILIALSRHSTAAAEAVMKCPRLINSIHELFVLDETLTWSARQKAIKLLKVLSIVKRSNCIEFCNMGIFEKSQLGLLHQALTVGSRKGIDEKDSWTELVESLHFWRVCVKYGLCISCFSDYYPALLFWIATPSICQSLPTNFSVKDATLAEASFHLLEALANTLPILHGSEDLEQSNSEFSSDFWSWKFAIPIIEDSLGWLSIDFVQGCTQNLMQLDDCYESAKAGPRLLLRVMSSVFHFLATVCHRIIDEGNSESAWLPTFVPKVGLQLIKSGMLCFSGREKSESSILSFVKCFAKIKHEISEEYLSDVMNCLFGLVDLLEILDHLLASVKDNQSSTSYSLNDSLGVEEILKCGLVASAKEELLQLLKDTGDDLIQKSNVLKKVSASRRGGPAPGVGVGWGCKGGGHWSHQMLTTQVELVLVQRLTNLLSLKGILSEDRNETRSIFCNARDPWTLKVNLVILNLAGPYHRDLIECILSESIFRCSSIEFYIKKTLILVKQWILKLENNRDSQQIENHLSNLYQKVSDIKHILLQHVRRMWLPQKVKQISEEIEDSDKKLVQERIKSKKRSILSTVPEDKAVISPTSNKRGLAIQWAGQKLPLPPFWFLSPLLSDAGLDTLGGGYDAGEVVRHGLVLFLGLEALTTSFPLHVPVAMKIHSLSNIFVMSDDVFLERGVNYMIGALQEKLMYELHFGIEDNETVDDIDLMDQRVPERIAEVDVGLKLDFEGLVDERYSSFLDKLTSQFASVSYGDLVFSRQIAIYLRRDVSDSLRLRVWKSIESERMLEFLPALEQCCGPSMIYFYPPEENQDLLQAYGSSLASGALDRARVRKSVSFSLATFHVAAFIFTNSGDDKAKSVRRTFAKNLLLQLAQRSQFQESLLELLKCKRPAEPDPTPYGVKESFVPPCPSEMKLRCTFLEEVCLQDTHIIDKIRQLKNL